MNQTVLLVQTLIIVAAKVGVPAILLVERVIGHLKTRETSVLDTDKRAKNMRLGNKPNRQTKEACSAF